MVSTMTCEVRLIGVRQRRTERAILPECRERDGPKPLAHRASISRREVGSGWYR